MAAQEADVSRTHSRGRAARAVAAVAAGAGLVAALCLVGVAPPAAAHEHDPEESGHPLRIVAYALHPVGVVLDYVIFRPAHWIVSFEPLSTLFGHDSEGD